jgi:GT2 family glycosyltransferase
MIKVFLVILNWNRATDTIECLRSVNQLSTTDCHLSVVVVDNASKDDSVKKISKLRSENRNLELIVNKANLGFAGGNNVGIRYALGKNADYVMVLNNDTIVDKDLLLNLLKIIKNDPDIAAVSPKIYFHKGFEFHKERYKGSEQGKVIWYAGGIVDWDNVYGNTRGVDDVDHGQYDKALETDFITGTCMLVRSDVIKKTGLFDEKYFMYYEDTDLSLRIRRKGYKILYVPDAIVWHKVAQSSAIGSELNDYFITRNRLLFGLRHAPFRSKIALVKESIKLGLKGRKWQKIGVRDFYLAKFGKGSWN